MAGEAIAAALVGLAALWLVIHPLFQTRRPDLPAEPPDLEETPRGVALAALKEIDFDRETGKLSEADYHVLKAKYTAAALEALRSDGAVSLVESLGAINATSVPVARGDSAARWLCKTCGPRPEPNPMFCSTCGLSLVPATLPSPASLNAGIYPKPVQPN
ncbi:MAG TPA: hypothetical protein VFH24_04040 [Gemmatimonadales bacterium]|nr:hypothetical protein [Gemmatimonadales bacterium]